MRRVILLTSIIATGCTARPGFNYDRAQGMPLSNTSPQNPSYIEAQRVAAAKNLNLHVVTKDGVRLFCRSELISGSHIIRDNTCYTAEQIERMDDKTQRDLKFFLNPNQPGVHPQQSP
jgi:hypothetical protein